MAATVGEIPEPRDESVDTAEAVEVDPDAPQLERYERVLVPLVDASTAP